MTNSSSISILCQNWPSKHARLALFHSMTSLKLIQTSFSPRPTFLHINHIFRKRKLIYICKSNSNPDNSNEETPPDSSKQELLVRIAMLQTQKVRLTDYLDERSAYLTKFAEEANAEIDQIGENALKELDEASDRIMGNIESKMQLFEESMEMDKLEIEESDQKLENFEERIEDERNEGLFFKNLREKKPVDKAKAMEEAEKITDLTTKSAGSAIRRNAYLAMITVVVVGIAEALIFSDTSSLDWKKVGVFVVVLVGLLSQFVYEQSMLSKIQNMRKKKSNQQED